jgi:hypothetical protein
MVDLPTQGGKFTWNNRRGGLKQVAERLDRYLVSESFFQSIQGLVAEIIPSYGSDHWPILVSWESYSTHRPKPFIFEKLWLRNPYFLPMMSIWWNSQPNIHGTQMYQFQQRLKYTKACIRKWNKEVFGNIQEERKKLEEKMEELQHQVILQGLSQELKLKEDQLK